MNLNSQHSVDKIIIRMYEVLIKITKKHLKLSNVHVRNMVLKKMKTCCF